MVFSRERNHHIYILKPYLGCNVESKLKEARDWCSILGWRKWLLGLERWQERTVGENGTVSEKIHGFKVSRR